MRAVGGVVLAVGNNLAVGVDVIADVLQAVVGQGHHLGVTHLVKEVQAGLDILLGLGTGLGDEVEAVVAGGGKGVAVDGADRGHRCDLGGIVHIGNGVVLKVFPDALAAVHRVDKDAGDALLGVNLEVGSTQI